MGARVVRAYLAAVADDIAETVLFAGVSDSDAKEVLRALLRSGPLPSWERVEHDRILDALRQREWSLVIADARFPLPALVERFAVQSGLPSQLPVLFLTSTTQPLTSTALLSRLFSHAGCLTGLRNEEHSQLGGDDDGRAPSLSPLGKGP